ncbi:OmpH family outer membrane protein [Roseibaca sp. Y0-43]|uniref:OmpH family outer membrane protein n=1 Tax=Roseibaca sp. Y0-43 TaxID=2816854 RepID=UPI001D0C2959|nr:OmpH family outer membrane protein [Roseibaca sp. Y0-43]MCC1480149.1 OmpH family outer membrane protein [Roseibaca sp. Y0-43]
MIQVVAGLCLATASFAQPQSGFSLGEPVGPAAGAPLVLRSIDEERLFRGSLFGQRVLAEIETASRALEEENATLLSELTAREEELTRLRDTMGAEEFRAEAEAFDQRAEEIRQSQAQKLARFSQFEESERRRFFSQTGPVLQRVLEEEGAQILIASGAVIIGTPGMDMTAAAIAAIDAEIGDGGTPPFPLIQP